MIYLDPSALVKLLVSDLQTPALQSFMVAHDGERHVVSELARLEVGRTLVRAGAEDLMDAADELLDGLDRMAVSTEILVAAGQLSDPTVRCLDAVHLASALRLGPALTAFVTYDVRLAHIAGGHGLPIAAPV